MEDTWAASLNDFAFALYQNLAQKDNYFISPYSISAALSMCLVGAQGETAAQLKRLLSLHNTDDVNTLNSQFESSLKSVSGDVALNTANKIFLNDGFELKKSFDETLRKFYGVSSQQLDFSKSDASAKTINDWVAEQTKDKIKDLIPSAFLNAMTRLVLVNAIYFKGQWANKFDSVDTYKEDFLGSTKKVDMMKLIDKKFKLHEQPEGIKATTCEFPYVGDSVAMTIILPDAGVEIEEVEKQLKHNTLSKILMQWTADREVHAYIPKFKLEHKIELSEQLKAMGAPLPFDQAKADFSGINDKPEGLAISKVVHQAVVEVNEEGTEAAAATGIVMVTYCCSEPLPPVEFKCNRPFIFVIHEKSTSGILFMGKYAKPQ